MESSAEMSAERSRWLATLTKKKQRSVHRRSQESKKRTTKSSKVESTYWRVLHKPGIVLLAPTKPSCAQFLTLAPRASPTCAMHKDTLAHGAMQGIIRMHTPSRIASLGLWSVTGQSSLVPRLSTSFLSLAVCTARAWERG